jgi:hypothetical protein
MIDISLGGLIGATLGIVVAALIFVPLVETAERIFRRAPEPGEDAEAAAPEQDLALLRRSVLVTDMLVCAGMGYWIGHMLFGG